MVDAKIFCCVEGTVAARTRPHALLRRKAIVKEVMLESIRECEAFSTAADAGVCPLFFKDTYLEVDAGIWSG